MSILSKKIENHLRKLKIDTEIAIKKELGEHSIIEISIKIIDSPTKLKATKTYIQEVKKLCLQDSKYSIQEMDGHRRFADLVQLRQIAMVIVKQTTHLSKAYIARQFDRKHSTFIHSEEIVEGQYNLYPQYRALYDSIYSKALKLKEIYI